MPDTTEPDADFSDDIRIAEKPGNGLDSQNDTLSSVKPSTSWKFPNIFPSNHKIAVANSPPIENLLDIKVPQDDRFAVAIIELLNSFSKLVNEIQTDIVEANKISDMVINNPGNYNRISKLTPYIMLHDDILKEIKKISNIFENIKNRKASFRSEIIKIKYAYENPNVDRPGKTTILSTIFGSDLRNDNHKYLYNFAFDRDEGPDFSFSDTVNNNTVSIDKKYKTPNIVFTNIFRLARDEYTDVYDTVMTGAKGGRNKKTRKSKKLKKRKTLKKSKIGKKMKKRRTLKIEKMREKHTIKNSF